MAEPARKLVTVAEFLRFEGEGDRRYQLIGGEIVMMAPPSPVHGALAASVSRVVGNQLRRPCRTLSDAGITLPWNDTSCYVADVAVTCSPLTGQSWCPDPVVIVEVLSPSTEAEDRGVKLPAYRRLASVQDILLVASNRVAVEHYARQAEQWLIADCGPGETVRLVGLPVEISVDELYADLGLPDEAAAAS
ncbi:MAG: Uma2 family endonuclease [Geminicoccaceae bacterium]